VLTGTLDWHWIFLINVPIGILVLVLAFMLLPKSKGEGAFWHLDFAGSITVTASLLLAVYGIVNGNQAGWLSMATLSKLGAAVVLMIIFLVIESRVRFPLMPLSLFKLRNVTVANIGGVLWAGGMFAWFFLSALYMQLILHYTPMQVGLAFLPSNLIMAALSLGLSAKIVLRFGVRKSLTVGLSLVTLGLLLFVRAPVDGMFIRDILPNMLLLGLGAGIAFNPMLLAAMNDVEQKDSGLASGMVNTAFMMGGALGLSILASLAASKSGALIAAGVDQLTAITQGYHLAFLVGACFAGLGATIVGLFLVDRKMDPEMQIAH
jgi:MFS family permease